MLYTDRYHNIISPTIPTCTVRPPPKLGIARPRQAPLPLRESPPSHLKSQGYQGGIQKAIENGDGMVT